MRTRRSIRLLTVVSLVSALLISASCNESVGPEESALDSTLLTPDAAALLDAKGYFPRQQPLPGYASPRSYASAAALADAYLASEVDSVMALSFKLERGEAIDVPSLRRCGRPQYAESAYEVSAMTASQPGRQYLVGRFFFSYCSRAGEALLTVTVPIEASLLSAPDTSRFRGIIARGVPLEIADLPALTAERAVRIAAARTGRRVAGAPQFVLPRFDSFIDHARWIVPLESPIYVYGMRTAEYDTLTNVMVGIDLFDTWTFAPRVLRPRLRATLLTRTDTNYNLLGGGGDMIYIARLGMPRGVESFTVLSTPD